MSHYFTRLPSVLVGFLFLGALAMPAVSATLQAQYAKYYIEQMTPVLLAKFTDAMPELPAQEAAAEVDRLVVKMAGCQFSSVAHYPQNYWDKAIKPIAAGKDIYQSNTEFERYLTEQIEQGAITKEQVYKLVYQAQVNVKACLKQ